MIFKTIEYAPWYSVSTTGEVKNTHTGRILKGHKTKDGRIRVVLTPDYKEYSVHKLVADAFLPKPEEGQMLIHKDGDNANNNVENLEYVSKKDYQRYLYSQGKNREHSVLSKSIRINETGEVFNSISECARYLGVDNASIRAQLYGKSKKCKGYTFTYI